jgi:hypothetical protein
VYFRIVVTPSAVVKLVSKVVAVRTATSLNMGYLLPAVGSLRLLQLPPLDST